MKYVHILGVSVVLSAALIFAASKAHAQAGAASMVPRNPIIANNRGLGSAGMSGGGLDRGFHGGFGGGVWVVEREPVVIEREVVREVPVPVPVEAAATKPTPKPYVIGNSYDALPGSCLKLIDDGVSYFYCSGDWYRQEGKQYRAVARQL